MTDLIQVAEWIIAATGFTAFGAALTLVVQDLKAPRPEPPRWPPDA